MVKRWPRCEQLRLAARQQADLVEHRQPVLGSGHQVDLRRRAESDHLAAGVVEADHPLRTLAAPLAVALGQQALPGRRGRRWSGAGPRNRRWPPRRPPCRGCRPRRCRRCSAAGSRSRPPRRRDSCRRSRRGNAALPDGGSAGIAASCGALPRAGPHAASRASGNAVDEAASPLDGGRSSQVVSDKATHHSRFAPTDLPRRRIGNSLAPRRQKVSPPAVSDPILSQHLMPLLRPPARAVREDPPAQHLEVPAGSGDLARAHAGPAGRACASARSWWCARTTPRTIPPSCTSSRTASSSGAGSRCCTSSATTAAGAIG